jgi:hypothetical protein
VRTASPRKPEIFQALEKLLRTLSQGWVLGEERRAEFLKAEAMICPRLRVKVFEQLVMLWVFVLQSPYGLDNALT